MEQTKKETLYGLMRREHGVTIAEAVDATGWKANTVRGFIASAKPHGTERIKRESGESAWRIKPAPVEQPDDYGI